MEMTVGGGAARSYIEGVAERSPRGRRREWGPRRDAYPTALPGDTFPGPVQRIHARMIVEAARERLFARQVELQFVVAFLDFGG